MFSLASDSFTVKAAELIVELSHHHLSEILRIFQSLFGHNESDLSS